MALMLSLLYLSCFFYTLALVIKYHPLCNLYLALQLSFYVMFLLIKNKVFVSIFYLSLYNMLEHT